MARFIIKETGDYYCPLQIEDTKTIDKKTNRNMVYSFGDYNSKKDLEFIVEALEGYYEHNYNLTTSKEEN